MPRALFTIAVLLLSWTAAAGSTGQIGGDAGSITGEVQLKPRAGGAAMPSAAYPTRAVGPRSTHDIPETTNVIVYLKDAAFRGALPVRKAEIRQEHETFVPHVVAVTRGSSLDFPNDDPIYHNVFSLSSGSSFNLGRYPKGESRTRAFPKAGIVKVYCQIHSHMSATIMVFDHPYFTVPQASGAFELPNIPPGDYTLVGWHERVGERTAAVHVERGKATRIVLRLPVEDNR
jgi:plastocyanin